MFLHLFHPPKHLGIGIAIGIGYRNRDRESNLSSVEIKSRYPIAISDTMRFRYRNAGNDGIGV